MSISLQFADVYEIHLQLFIIFFAYELVFLSFQIELVMIFVPQCVVL